eukprot:1160159-Pelagomonas_calceolata.AAC.1
MMPKEAGIRNKNKSTTKCACSEAVAAVIVHKCVQLCACIANMVGMVVEPHLQCLDLNVDIMHPGIQLVELIDVVLILPAAGMTGRTSHDHQKDTNTHTHTHTHTQKRTMPAKKQCIHTTFSALLTS